MRFLMASFHLCGRRAEHTVQLAVLGIIHLVLDCLGTQIYKLSIGFFGGSMTDVVLSVLLLIQLSLVHCRLFTMSTSP